MNKAPFTPRRRRATRNAILACIGTLAAGLSTLFGSWLFRDADPWWAATLGNAGVAVLLLVPGEVALAYITSSFKQIERATAEVRSTAETARDIAERTARSLEDVRETLMERQMAEHEAELDVYRGIVRDPSRESLLRALRHATETGVITQAGVRSPVWETNLHYRFLLDSPEAELVVRLETDSGKILSTHPWVSATPPETFYQSLVQGVRYAGRDLGVKLNDPTQSVEELADMLVEVTRLRAQELLGHRDTFHKIIERREGWYFTERYVIPADDLHYCIEVPRLDEMDWEEHLLAKGWYGVGAALGFARTLYGTDKKGD